METVLASDFSFDWNNLTVIQRGVIEFYYLESLKEYIINFYREDMKRDISWYQNSGEGGGVGLIDFSRFEHLDMAVSPRALRLERLERPWKAFHSF